MLSFIELTNFKSFSHVMFDLRGVGGKPKKLAFIYGENGSGKSNLMDSLLFLGRSCETLNDLVRARELFDLEDDLLKLHEIIGRNRGANSSLVPLRMLIRESRTIGSDSPMILRFGFHVDGKDGEYTLTFDHENIIKEELIYQITERRGTILRVSTNEISLSPTVFHDEKYKEELTENIKKYWGKNTFISIMFNEYETKNRAYVDARIGISLKRVIDWIKLCSVSSKYRNYERIKSAMPSHFLHQLNQGSVLNRNDKELKAFENALNCFFTQLYSDIKSVYYAFKRGKNGYSYELHFKKMINDRLVDVPISMESTGTQKLLDFFPFMFTSVLGASIFVDEIDSGIHDLLMVHIIDLLKDSLQGQCIATTHNTLLMEDLHPENIYMINSDARGNKKIVCVSDYKRRTQKNHNMRKKYLDGDYAGMPYLGYFDVEEMVDEVVKESGYFSDVEGD